MHYSSHPLSNLRQKIFNNRAPRTTLLDPVLAESSNAATTASANDAGRNLNLLRSTCNQFLDLRTPSNQSISDPEDRVRAGIVTNVFMGTVRAVLRESLPLVRLLNDHRDKYEYAKISLAYVATAQVFKSFFEDAPNAMSALDSLGYAGRREFIQTIALSWADAEVGVCFWIPQPPGEPIPESGGATMVFSNSSTTGRLGGGGHDSTTTSVPTTSIPSVCTQPQSSFQLPEDRLDGTIDRNETSMPNNKRPKFITMLIKSCVNLLADTQPREHGRRQVHWKWAPLRQELANLIGCCDALTLKLWQIGQVQSSQARAQVMVAVYQIWHGMVHTYTCLGYEAKKRAGLSSSKQWTDLNTAFEVAQNSIAILGVPPAQSHHPDENVPSIYYSGSAPVSTHHLSQFGDNSAAPSHAPYGATSSTMRPYSHYSPPTDTTGRSDPLPILEGEHSGVYVDDEASQVAKIHPFTSDAVPASSTGSLPSFVVPMRSIVVSSKASGCGAKRSTFLAPWNSPTVSAPWK
ncbi:hypothetical protein QFC24_006300 [Naganishia onofrii]|uniref:Uncharacterized protein n=1 Tax=Naganishia onofrii TaxID=1851511 RepID=A0ACC2X1X3_9TREE|nr:hypothetical protein QFC24_006300 [Naganishia onofrii]